MNIFCQDLILHLHKNLCNITNMNSANEFWNRVKALVYGSGNNFEWLYLETGISRSTASSQKRRGTLPKVDDGLKIAKALKTTLTYLVTGEKDNELEEFLVRFKKYEKLLFIIEEIPAEKLDLVRRMLELIRTDSLTAL